MKNYNGWINIGALWRSNTNMIKGSIDMKLLPEGVDRIPIVIFVNKNKNKKHYPDYLIYTHEKPEMGKKEEKNYNVATKEVNYDDVPF